MGWWGSKKNDDAVAKSEALHNSLQAIAKADEAQKAFTEFLDSGFIFVAKQISNNDKKLAADYVEAIGGATRLLLEVIREDGGREAVLRAMPELISFMHQIDVATIKLEERVATLIGYSYFSPAIIKVNTLLQSLLEEIQKKQ